MSFEHLLDIVRARGSKCRSITAIAGAPGAGKSTAAERMVDALNDREPGSAAILPMDGFHLDDGVLIARGLLQRKGAPETFDFGGLASVLSRLKANAEAEIAVPVFDRSIEISRAGARVIGQSVRHLVVEGNYLLLDADPWRRLQGIFDTTVLLAVSEDVLRSRLAARWAALGFDGVAALAKLETNDLPNATLVTACSIVPEFLLANA